MYEMTSVETLWETVAEPVKQTASNSVFLSYKLVIHIPLLMSLNRFALSMS